MQRQKRIMAMVLLAGLVGVLPASGQAKGDRLLGRHAPPAMVLRAPDGTRQASKHGTFCWKSGCLYSIRIAVPAEPLVLSPRGLLWLDLRRLGPADSVSFAVYDYARSVGVGGWLVPHRGEALSDGELGAGSIFSLPEPLRIGRYVINVTAYFADHRASNQAFHVRVGSTERIASFREFRALAPAPGDCRVALRRRGEIRRLINEVKAFPDAIAHVSPTEMAVTSVEPGRGEITDEATVSAVLASYRERLACLNINERNRATALESDVQFRHTLAQMLTKYSAREVISLLAPQRYPNLSRDTLYVMPKSVTVFRLPGGRLGFIARYPVASVPYECYVEFKYSKHRWWIDSPILPVSTSVPIPRACG